MTTQEVAERSVDLVMTDWPAAEYLSVWYTRLPTAHGNASSVRFDTTEVVLDNILMFAASTQRQWLHATMVDGGRGSYGFWYSS